MIEALAELMRAGFGVVISCLLPLFVVAAVAAIAFGLLAGALGLRDAAIGQLLRALAVVLALSVIVEQVAAATVEFAAYSWAGLDGSMDVGR